jgi:hypothetical protein
MTCFIGERRKKIYPGERKKKGIQHELAGMFAREAKLKVKKS